MKRVLEDDSLPELARELFQFQAREYAAVEARLEEIETKLMRWQRDDDVSRRLSTIPGVGPIGSAMLSMKAPPPELFKSGRDFAAWIGLTPKDHSTGGRQRHGGITKAGDSALRATLVVGATALLRHAARVVTSPRLGLLRCWSERRQSWLRWPWPTNSPVLPGA